ncbi:MAG: hypothetical protein LBI05_00775 [Planctomycetaceae bacterium]|jgi:sirohydrochlorin ferrochelatase|nr:hypothetical protein [Planctomycetaceae bacterium]
MTIIQTSNVSLFPIILAIALLSASIERADAQQTESNTQRGKPGLLLISHGSPAKPWNDAVAVLAEKVNARNAEKKTFHAVANAYMEFAQPDIADGIEKLEAAGCDRIIAVPLFVFSASHVHFDVPAILGTYSSPSVRKSLEEEKIRIASPKVPVTLTQTLDEGELFSHYIRDEIAALSKNPKEEAVVLIQHGDPSHANLIEPTMMKLLVEGCGSRGITAGTWVDCQVGQSYWRNVVPEVKELAERRKRILMVGLYFVSSAKSIHQRGISGMETHYEDIEVLMSEKGIIDHADMADWVWNAATEALPAK